VDERTRIDAGFDFAERVESHTRRRYVLTPRYRASDVPWLK